MPYLRWTASPAKNVSNGRAGIPPKETPAQFPIWSNFLSGFFRAASARNGLEDLDLFAVLFDQMADVDDARVAGVGASEDDVQQVLLQLSDHDDIRLAGEPGAPGGLAVVYVDPELCP